MESYVSARGRTLAITVLTLAQMVVLVLSTMAWANGGIQLDGNLSGAASSFRAAGGLAILDSLLFLAATIVFLTWVYRAIANLPALGSLSCRFTPGGAVWSFFIPFVNLVRGHQVMATIWQESQPPAVNEHGFYLPRKTTVVSWWWGGYLLLVVADLAQRNASPFSVVELRSFVETQVFVNLARLATATLFLVMVRGAQRRQDEQWQDLERRRNVPQPTADALR